MAAADLAGDDVDLATIKTAMESYKSDPLPRMTFFDNSAGSISAPAAMHFLGPATNATALVHFIDFIADCEIQGEYRDAYCHVATLLCCYVAVSLRR